MGHFKTISLELDESQCRYAVIVPFQPRRYFKTWMRARAYALVQRATGRLAYIIGG
ncbi:MAG: hypothetical protein KGJ38_08325 [Burkholderiaceae bacterium]|nr:hypothetical protein [Burkholderiaceae bacterium]